MIRQQIAELTIDRIGPKKMILKIRLDGCIGQGLLQRGRS